MPSAEFVNRALSLVEDQQKTMKKPIFTARHSVWKLVGEVTKNLEGDVVEEEDSVLLVFAGGEIRDTPSCDRIQIYFEDRPSEAVRRGLKSSAWRWSPTNGVWQRKRTENARVSARRIVSDVYLPDIADNGFASRDPDDNAVSVLGMVTKVKEETPVASVPEKPVRVALSFEEKVNVLRLATSGFARRYSQWQQDNGDSGMTDLQVRELLQETFPDGGGSVSGHGYSYLSRPAGLKVWIQSQDASGKDALVWSGMKTVRMVREIYKIPDPDGVQGDFFR